MSNRSDSQRNCHPDDRKDLAQDRRGMKASVATKEALASPRSFSPRDVREILRFAQNDKLCLGQHYIIARILLSVTILQDVARLAVEGLKGNRWALTTMVY